MNVKERLQANAALVEEALIRYTSEQDADFASVLEAERYSLIAPRAKRIRPTLVLEFCRLFDGNDAAALPFAAAIEMIHTYSLIHDDLPAMDNDDYRRGRPTCHKAFGEAIAILAGDSLLTRAFEVATSDATIPAQSVCEAVRRLARAAGGFGMIGGQTIDLAGEKVRLDMKTLLKLHAHKTGALIRVSAALGCLAAGISPQSEDFKAAEQYADRIGLAFQIVDDVLDATADEQTAGKSVGSDAENGKTTFLTYYTPAEALAYAERLTAEAKAVLPAERDTSFLMELADYLMQRKY